MSSAQNVAIFEEKRHALGNFSFIGMADDSSLPIILLSLKFVYHSTKANRQKGQGEFAIVT